MKYCFNCGEKLPEEAAFCGNCGQNQNEAVQEASEDFNKNTIKTEEVVGQVEETVEQTVENIKKNESVQKTVNIGKNYSHYFVENLKRPGSIINNQLTSSLINIVVLGLMFGVMLYTFVRAIIGYTIKSSLGAFDIADELARELFDVSSEPVISPWKSILSIIITVAILLSILLLVTYLVKRFALKKESTFIDLLCRLSSYLSFPIAIMAIISLTTIIGLTGAILFSIGFWYVISYIWIMFILLLIDDIHQFDSSNAYKIYWLGSMPSLLALGLVVVLFVIGVVFV